MNTARLNFSNGTVFLPAYALSYHAHFSMGRISRCLYRAHRITLFVGLKAPFPKSRVQPGSGNSMSLLWLPCDSAFKLLSTQAYTHLVGLWVHFKCYLLILLTVSSPGPGKQ
jgi:hypothetical protein